MLDTNTCIYIMNKRPPNVAEKFAEHDPDDIAISSIVVSELIYGINKNKSPINRLAVERFLEPMLIVSFDSSAAHRSGEIRAVLEGKGMKIGPYDTQIAGHAISLNATLVTNDSEFSRVQGLRIENWV
jgi:tRNA(fMet)-specific endonuclease VapC